MRAATGPRFEAGDLVIRPADSGDIPALHTLIESAYRGATAKRGWTHEADLLGGQRTDRVMLAEVISDPAQRILLAEQGGVLIGCVQLCAKDDGLFYLGLLSVAPDSQASGLGKRLLHAAEDEAHRAGGRAIEMTVIRQRPELIAYYERRGYAPTGEARPFPYGDPRFGHPARDDLDFVVLMKAL
ncbi:MAG: GCN5 family acetyltransferase [Proteobacteria bacterium SG_bin6]|nr:MAG: GCN5 family acetyltransferase [Proteobacteria bacterium SG_bin6]